jgi:hypothetical protein
MKNIVINMLLTSIFIFGFYLHYYDIIENHGNEIYINIIQIILYINLDHVFNNFLVIFLFSETIMNLLLLTLGMSKIKIDTLGLPMNNNISKFFLWLYFGIVGISFSIYFDYKILKEILCVYWIILFFIIVNEDIIFYDIKKLDKCK